VPDLDQEIASHGGDGDIAVAFSGEEFPAPFAPGRGAAIALNGLSALDEEMVGLSPRPFLPTPSAFMERSIMGSTLISAAMSR
jgi:hypothetical protein